MKGVSAIGSDKVTQRVTVNISASQATNLEQHLNFRGIKKPPADYSGAAERNLSCTNILVPLNTC